MFENPRRGRQARNFTTNVSKILALKSSSEQIFFRKLSLGAPAFCMNYAIFWAKLEVMVITLEPRTSNIAGSSCKYTDGFFICFYITSIALSLLDMSQVGVIVFWIFIEDPYIFSYHYLAINDAMHKRTVYDKCRLQCAAWKCYTDTSARAYGVIIFI